jgi:hypothetical protein
MCGGVMKRIEIRHGVGVWACDDGHVYVPSKKWGTWLLVGVLVLLEVTLIAFHLWVWLR